MRGACFFRAPDSTFQDKARRVSPKIFEAVIGAFVRVKNMHNDICVIGNNPLTHRKAVDGERPQSVLLFEFVSELIDDRLQMWFGGSGTNDKKVGKARDAPQIESDDVFGFLVARDISNGLGELL